MSNYPVHQGGRASEQWGTTVRPTGYGLVWAPPTPTPTPVLEAAEMDAQPQPQPVDANSTIVDVANEWSTSTVVDADGSVGWCGRWLVRLVLRIVVHKRRP